MEKLTFIPDPNGAPQPPPSNSTNRVVNVPLKQIHQNMSVTLFDTTPLSTAPAAEVSQK
jgi:hypothetical protein